MALSLSGRKLLVETVACVAALAIGAVLLTHRLQAEQWLTDRFGIPFAHTAQASNLAATSDDGIVRASRGRSVELTAKQFGHFFAEAEVNGSRVDVLVDTGASAVALTYDDARRVGVLPNDRDFTGRSSTANGIARYAPIVIDRITIGDIEVRNVQAAVMEDGKLETTLLGMSFLSKLGRVDMRSGRLVLEE